MEFLFIGGHHDGLRKEIGNPDGRPVFLQHDPNPDPVSPNLEVPIPLSKTYAVECYKPIPFAAGKHKFTIYALDGLGGAQVLHALIERYPQPQ